MSYQVKILIVKFKSTPFQLIKIFLTYAGNIKKSLSKLTGFLLLFILFFRKVPLLPFHQFEQVILLREYHLPLKSSS